MNNEGLQRTRQARDATEMADDSHYFRKRCHEGYVSYMVNSIVKDHYSEADQCNHWRTLKKDDDRQYCKGRNLRIWRFEYVELKEYPNVNLGLNRRACFGMLVHKGHFKFPGATPVAWAPYCLAHRRNEGTSGATTRLRTKLH
ncbi:hypothetical protein Tco_0637296 [Tanacetum coccineum]